jgi:hypothetical protein
VPDGQHQATQTPEPVQRTQTVETMPPVDIALQTTLPHSGVKELQTDPILLQEVCTQYSNPLACSQGSMTAPANTSNKGMNTDIFPSRHIQTYDVKTAHKKTGPRAVSCMSQTDEMTLSAITQTDPIIISEPSHPYVQTLGEYLQEKSLQLQALQMQLHDIQYITRNTNGVT